VELVILFPRSFLVTSAALPELRPGRGTMIVGLSGGLPISEVVGCGVLRSEVPTVPNIELLVFILNYLDITAICAFD